MTISELKSEKDCYAQTTLAQWSLDYAEYTKKAKQARKYNVVPAWRAMRIKDDAILFCRFHKLPFPVSMFP